MANELEIKGFDFVEFYVGSAKMVAYWYVKAMGFDIVAYQGPETGFKDKCSYYLKQNDIHIVLTSPLSPAFWEATYFLNLHGDGVKRFGYQVSDVEALFDHAINSGGIPIKKPSVAKDAQGEVLSAALKIYDDTEIILCDRSQYQGLFMPGFDEPRQKLNIERQETGLQKIDHIVGNVRQNEMNRWADYFIRAFNFEQFIEFGPGDISTQYSALLSKVVKSHDFAIRNPINEPYEGKRKSQIEEYLDVYHGSGVQHIALESDDIMASIQALRSNGIEFLSVPQTYYDELKKRNPGIVTEDIDALADLGILCDIEDLAGGEGYLLQLFTKPIGDRPSFFYEIIQRRKGSQGFGQGNFQALFEAIERDQESRGNL
ncbi:4-hydroxyphenylpyruvate dioxygenase [bacterium]|nr:4-hydroxyphenylpyruvate dioxygenase [bacterium]